MKSHKQLLLLACLSFTSIAQASSVSIINPTITFTLTDVLVGGVSADPNFDYEGDSPVSVGGGFTDYSAFGGTGSTSGSAAFTQNGVILDPNNGGNLLGAGDTLSISLNNEATANTGFIGRDQIGGADFSYFNYTDDGFGSTDTLSFLFDYAVSYTTSLSNDVAGDQALVDFTTSISLTDYDLGGTTTINLFQGIDKISELSNAAGTLTPGGMQSGSFQLDLAGGAGAFVIEAKASTSSFVNTVPVPAAVWLFGSGLIALAGLARRDAA